MASTHTWCADTQAFTLCSDEHLLQAIAQGATKQVTRRSFPGSLQERKRSSSSQLNNLVVERATPWAVAATRNYGFFSSWTHSVAKLLPESTRGVEVSSTLAGVVFPANTRREN